MTILQQSRPQPGQGHTVREGLGLDLNPDQVLLLRDTNAVGEKVLRRESQNAVGPLSGSAPTIYSNAW